MGGLRARKLLHSPPIVASAGVARVPAPPILLNDKGECYKLGSDYPQDDDWEERGALSAWSGLGKKRMGENGGRCIM